MALVAAVNVNLLERHGAGRQVLGEDTLVAHRGVAGLRQRRVGLRAGSNRNVRRQDGAKKSFSMTDFERLAGKGDAGGATAKGGGANARRFVAERGAGETSGVTHVGPPGRAAVVGLLLHERVLDLGDACNTP